MTREPKTMEELMDVIISGVLGIFLTGLGVSLFLLGLKLLKRWM